MVAAMARRVRQAYKIRLTDTSGSISLNSSLGSYPIYGRIDDTADRVHVPSPLARGALA